MLTVTDTLVIVIVLVIFIIAVPLVSAFLGKHLYKGGIPKGYGDRIAELSATIRYVLLTIPTLVAILGFLGVASYKDIINKVREEIHNTYSLDEARRAKIESDSLRHLAQENYELILSTKDSLDSIIAKQISAILPVGTVVAFKGEKEDLDDNWAICDGKTYSGVKTPNLIDKFILGADWGTKEKSSSKSLHEQLALEPTSERENIKVAQALNVVPSNIKIPKYKISVLNRNTMPLPPFYALVYIMKVK